MTLSRCTFALAVTCLAICAGCATPQAATPAAAPTSAQAGATTIVAIAPPAPQHPSIWRILGVPQAYQGLCNIRTRITSVLGSRFPGLEGRPPMVPIADPANADSPTPAVAAAADVKAQEDAAPQKIKAIRYLAKIGCEGRYRQVEDALVQAMDDPNAKVRLAAVKAVRGTAGDPCKSCQSGSCCSPKVMKKLYELANETDSFGCYKEPSEEVRRNARLAMNACGGAIAPAPLPTEGPSEVPTEALPPANGVKDDPVAWHGPAQNNYAVRADYNARMYGGSYQQPNNLVAPDDPGLVLARVDGTAIYQDEIARRVDHHLGSLDSNSNADRIRRSALEYEVNREINDKLLVADARRRLAPMDFYHLVRTSGRNETNANLDGAPIGYLMRNITTHDIASAWLRRQSFDFPHISHDELAAEYRKRGGKNILPRSVRWVMLVAPRNRFTSREDANAALELIQKGPSSGELEAEQAEKLSLIEERKFDWMPIKDVDNNAIANTLTALPAGKISHVMENAEGLFVIRIVDEQASRRIPFEEISHSLHDEIMGVRRARAEADYIEQLRQASVVWTIFDQPAAVANRQRALR